MSNLEIKKTILNKIKEYDRILLFRHFRPDGDAVGSTKGLAAIIKATWPEKEVLHVNEDYAKYLEFMGPENAPVPEEKFADLDALRTEIARNVDQTRTFFRFAQL